MKSKWLIIEKQNVIDVHEQFVLMPLIASKSSDMYGRLRFILTILFMTSHVIFVEVLHSIILM